MVKVAPEEPSSSTGTCLVSALSWGEHRLLLGWRGLLGLGGTGADGLRHDSDLEGKFEHRHGLLGVPLDGEDTFASRHLHEVVGWMSRRHELG